MGLTLRSTPVLLDLLIDPFAATWSQVRDLAVAGEERGYAGIWTWDHLSGVVHGQDHVLEGWTLLSALAVETSRVMLGPLVLNQANRDAGVVAQMAATLQEVSGGRLLLGVGAGTSPTGSYVAEQLALGREPAHDPERRAALAEYIGVVRQAWGGEVGGVGGFLRPEPPPPIIVAAFGPKLAAIAGQVADGINTQAALPALEGVVAEARAAAPDPDAFLVTVFAGLGPDWLDPDSARRRRLDAVGVDRLILVVAPDQDPARLPHPGN
jgi:alkanesulfonate monooxygenase SsuD/methylene tetrahydromethanopterin reductase-like flavin-dependent oxidoreductase (luciferase family)